MAKQIPLEGNNERNRPEKLTVGKLIEELLKYDKDTSVAVFNFENEDFRLLQIEDIEPEQIEMIEGGELEDIVCLNFIDVVHSEEFNEEWEEDEEPNFEQYISILRARILSLSQDINKVMMNGTINANIVFNDAKNNAMRYLSTSLDFVQQMKNISDLDIQLIKEANKSKDMVVTDDGKIIDLKNDEGENVS